MVRKAVCAAAALTVLLGLGIPAKATERPEKTGSIRITLDTQGEKVTEGTVVLYQAGFPISGGYQIDQAFGGGMVTDEDACSPHLAQWLYEMEGDGGETRYLDADGTVEYSGLTEGLYLLVQTEAIAGYAPFKAFLLTVPTEGCWDVQASLLMNPVDEDNPRTGQTPLPYIGMAGMLLSGSALLLLSRRRGRK